MLYSKIAKRRANSNQPDKPAGTASPSNRCGHCIGNGKRRKVFFVKKRKIDAYPMIRKMIDDGNYRFTKEGLAVDLGVHVDCVHQALMRLNREGLLTQRSNSAPHDSTRDRMGAGSDSAWQASVYCTSEKVAFARQQALDASKLECKS